MGSTGNLEGCITLGPWGGSHGKEWTYRPGGFIRTIIVKHGDTCVVSIEFRANHSDLEFQPNYDMGETERFIYGGKGGSCRKLRRDKISFDDPDEYLMSISGTLAGYDGCNEVKSICFKTNKKCYGPYGTTTQRDTVFSCDCNSGVIVGFQFHGREDAFELAAIGVYVMPESLAFAKSSAEKGKRKHESCSTMPRMVMLRDEGPWGGCEGYPWDDGLFATVKKIRIHLDILNLIYALQFEYLKKDGKSVLSKIHGGPAGSIVEIVDLDVKEDEYLIGISGYYGPVEGFWGLDAVKSISFHSNKRIYGPYGHERGETYASKTIHGKVVGFHGMDNAPGMLFLGAIGVHMKYF